MALYKVVLSEWQRMAIMSLIDYEIEENRFIAANSLGETKKLHDQRRERFEALLHQIRDHAIPHDAPDEALT